MYRLAQCFVHSSGALLLELQDGERYDRQLRCLAPARGANGAAAAAAAPTYAVAPAAALPGLQPELPAPLPAIAGGAPFPAAAEMKPGGEGGYDDYGPAGDMDNDDDDYGGPDYGGAGDYEMAEGTGTGHPAGAGGEGAPGAHAGVAVPQAAARERPARRRGRGAAADGEEGEYFDPYKPLDVNEANPALVKPLQASLGGVGGCLRVTRCIMALPRC